MEKSLQKGTVRSLNVSDRKGIKKTPVDSIEVTLEGIAGDAHAGDWHRQLSFLADESVDEMRRTLPTILPGDFAENITTRGIDYRAVRIGQKVRAGSVLAEITQIGKECHTACEIKTKVGYCIMPTEGVFAKVTSPGTIKTGDEVVIYE